MSSSNSKIVFVIGAGAASEVNMPTGKELKSKVADLLSFEFEGVFGQLQTGDSLLSASIDSGVSLEVRRERYLACHQIRSAMPQALSIDNLLDAHKGNVEFVRVGKLAIVRAILGSESECLLRPEPSQYGPRLNFWWIEDTWYNRLFQLLSENCELRDLRERLSQVCFVVFNYDRTLEHFLLNAIKN